MTAETKLLEDHSMEIPPWLLRSPDGGMKYPGIPAPLVPPEAANIDVTAHVTRNFRLTEADKTAIQQIVRSRDLEVEKRRAARDLERKAQKKEIHTRLAANKLSQRKVFVKHFKWDIPI